MPEKTTEEAKTDSARRTKRDDTDRALYWYMMTQMLKALSILGGLAIIGHVLSKLRGG